MLLNGGKRCGLDLSHLRPIPLSLTVWGAQGPLEGSTSPGLVVGDDFLSGPRVPSTAGDRTADSLARRMGY